MIDNDTVEFIEDFSKVFEFINRVNMPRKNRL